MLSHIIVILMIACSAHSRAVNLSSVWLLPEEGYPVFYRYFRDRITWYEAEAVCQFHHGQLLTVDTPNEFDAARAYLKELDVSHFVWTGLRRAGPNDKFFWPESKVMEHEGYWLQEIPKSNDAVCAAIDPASDYRWQPLPCSGPQAAAFICQMEVPKWAIDMCMVTSLPSLTVTFLPEQGALELVSDCGFEGTRRIACKGTKVTKREELISQLRCESWTESTPVATSTAQQQEWEETTQTRLRRESQVTPDMEHTQSVTTASPVHDQTITPEPTAGLSSTVATTLAKAKEDATTTTLPTTTQEEATTTAPTTGTTTSTMRTTMTMEESTTAAKIVMYPVPDSELVVVEDERTKQAQLQVHKAELAIRRDEARKAAAGVLSNTLELNERIPIEDRVAVAPSLDNQPRRTVLVSSKPIPPSLGGNSPFLEPISENTTASSAEEETEKDSHESFNESPTEFVQKGNKTSTTGTPAPVSVSETMEESGEVHPDAANATASTDGLQSELPERPNRGRLLVHPQHHSFYPYFLNRVLG